MPNPSAIAPAHDGAAVDTDADASMPTPDTASTDVAQATPFAAAKETNADAPKGWQAIGLLVVLGLTTALGPLAIDMYLPAFNRIASDLHVPLEKVQWTLPVFLAGLAAGQLLWGPLSDRVGRRLPLLFGAVAFAVASGLAAMSPSLGWLMVWRFAMGLSGAAGVVVVRAVVRDVFDEVQSARAYATMMLVVGIAPVAAPTLGGEMLKHFHWSAIFWFMVGFSLLMTAVIALCLPESLPKHTRQSGRLKEIASNYAQVLKVKQFWVYSALEGLATGMLFAYITRSQDVFVNVYKLSPQAFAYYFGACALGLFALSQTNRFLLNRWEPLAVLKSVCVANAVLGVAMFAVVSTGTGGFWGFYSLLFLCMATLGLLMPNAMAVAMAPFAKRAGSASALMGVLRHLVGALAGLLISFWHSQTATPIAAAFAMCGVGCVLLFLIPLPEVGPPNTRGGKREPAGNADAAAGPLPPLATVD